MTQTQKRFFSLLPILLIVGNELVRTYIRPLYGKEEFGLLSVILGWLPNFLAPLAFMTLGILLVILLQDLLNKPITRRVSLFLLGVFILFGLVGFIGHEVTQKGTGLFYDVHDIYATLGGLFVGSVIYYYRLLSS